MEGIVKQAEIAADLTAAAQGRIRGRSAYSIEIVDAICAGISEGETVTAVLERLDIRRRTFFGWVRQHNEAAALYQAARLARGEYCRDQLVELNEKLELGKIDPQSARVLADNLKWMAAKDAPALFSERVELTGANGADLIPEDKPRDILELARWMALVMTRAEKQLEEQEPATLAEKKRLLSFD